MDLILIAVVNSTKILRLKYALTWESLSYSDYGILIFPTQKFDKMRLPKSQTREKRQTLLEFTSILDKSQFDNFLGSDDSLKI